MTTVAILPEHDETGETVYQAVSAGRVSIGRTAGEALDAITAGMSPEETGMLVVVQNHAPDRFFTASQRSRLRELMDRWRAARDAGQALPEPEQAELQALVDAEMEAAVLRSEAMVAPVP